MQASDYKVALFSRIIVTRIKMVKYIVLKLKANASVLSQAPLS
jgi:hypothetical protein